MVDGSGKVQIFADVIYEWGSKGSCWISFYFHFQSTYKFVGKKSRTKEQLQSKMYSDEMDTWLAEERQEAAKTQVKN
jgi:hypothetical protein